MTPPPLRVAFMTGHDDDVVLDPSIQRLSRATRDSRWRGMQSDAAIVDAVATSFPHLTISTVTTVEELLATDAEVVVIISYRTQPSFAWYATFFEALRTSRADPALSDALWAGRDADARALVEALLRRKPRERLRASLVERHAFVVKHRAHIASALGGDSDSADARSGQ